ncbi:MAG TPA: MFS transporter [Nocardioides sp.]|uniref:MFS transporter n=1 Tax=uncultured Nocardioides sp. TaxID=198441 RepID=UPI000EE74DB0|nr:MFS transporter [uncultured Nocardioides sp.]HCB06170.1 MFS transporter [Nocardioides sp.]HRD60838.1 MFS transporter [Nocardioides sp.]HRI94694.1 MFS transporter [Nocardioides sp.]HRK44503.1 MFS transporter [Nocardioides sp.]
MSVETGRITTDIPARLDRLPWARWHWLVVIGLGTVWILDGLEVTIVGSMSDALKPDDTGLGMSSFQIGFAGAAYVAGACLGALFFGQLTDRLGRKRLFMVSLGVYTIATVLTAFSMNPAWYFAARFLTGTGIGGEYAAINSAIDELIPAKYRGRVDVAINGSFWIGAAGGALLTIPLLDPTVIDQAWGWRLAFGLGAILAVGILLVRRNVPESPRWLFIHGREDEAEDIVRDIEKTVSEESDSRLEDVSDTITIRQRTSIGIPLIARTVFTMYPKRTVLCLSLFVGQAFLYNAFFFTYGDTLTTFLDVKQTGWYIAIFAASNFVGALVLSPLFDSVGRVRMITATYVVSGALLAITGVFLGSFTAVTLTLMGAIIFFFASAGASAAYLTASEVFPMETRALCIAFFYAIGTAAGGISGPLLFGWLIDKGTASGDITTIAIGYFIGAALMIGGGIVEAFLGVRAEGQSLESIARPLTAEDADRPASDSGQTSPAPAG